MIESRQSYTGYATLFVAGDESHFALLPLAFADASDDVITDAKFLADLSIGLALCS